MRQRFHCSLQTKLNNSNRVGLKKAAIYFEQPQQSEPDPEIERRARIAVGARPVARQRAVTNREIEANLPGRRSDQHKRTHQIDDVDDVHCRSAITRISSPEPRAYRARARWEAQRWARGHDAGWSTP